MPFPLIEDGDFPIPAAAIRPDLAEEVLDREGETAEISLRSTRRPGSACNVEATRGPQDRRLLVIAHIDSKPGTPGAVDNASGVVVLLLVAELLTDRTQGPIGVELLVVNGEVHYGASEPLADAMGTLFHSPDDTPDQVEPTQLVDAALAIAELVESWSPVGDDPGTGPEDPEVLSGS